MPPHNLVAIGGSAGSIEVLQWLVGALPTDVDAAVVVVVHIPPGARSHLPEILARRSSMPVHQVRDGAALQGSHVYVAGPDRHVTVEDGRLRVVAGPRQNRHRPSIDPLFRSAARWYAERAVGVVLSGAPGDGVAGAIAVAHRGGTVLVQDPAEALFSGMPERVLLEVDQAIALPAEALPAAIARRLAAAAPGRPGAATPRVPAGPMTPTIVEEVDMPAVDGPSELERAGSARAASASEPQASYGCPDCGGVLLEASDGTLRRFRCRIGHEYGSEALRLAQLSSLEDALWAAIRGLEESADLADRLRAVTGDGAASARHGEHAEDAREHADQIRQFLLTLLADPRGQNGRPVPLPERTAS